MSPVRGWDEQLDAGRIPQADEPPDYLCARCGRAMNREQIRTHGGLCCRCSEDVEQEVHHAATGESSDPLREAVEVASGGAIVIRCVSCSGSMLTTGYVEHHDDGSHTFTPIRALSPATLPPSCPGGDECPH